MGVAKNRSFFCDLGYTWTTVNAVACMPDCWSALWWHTRGADPNTNKYPVHKTFFYTAVSAKTPRKYGFANLNSAATHLHFVGKPEINSPETYAQVRFCQFTRQVRGGCVIRTLRSGTSSQMFYRFRRAGSPLSNKKEAKLQQRRCI